MHFWPLVNLPRLQAAIDWSRWGEAAPSDVAPMLPLAPVPTWPSAPAPSADVVVQARQQWAESSGQPLPPAPLGGPPAISLRPVQPMGQALGQPLGQLGDARRQIQREEPEIDPISGLEVSKAQMPELGCTTLVMIFVPETLYASR
eukprot:Skav210292  [mRNA]  locus=scaffold475:67093:67530:- [translate_table: standard]